MTVGDAPLSCSHLNLKSTAFLVAEHETHEAMSKIRSPSDRKPPLAVSPKRLRPRQILRSSINNTVQVPPASSTKWRVPISSLGGLEESKLRPEEYRSISCELRALKKMVEDEFGNSDLVNMAFPSALSVNSSPLFERGRFYDAYSARRNDRLKRKKVETEEDGTTPHNNTLGVAAVESGKRRNSKKFERLRRSVPADFSIGHSETPRYSLRSSKENKKPDYSNNVQKSVVEGDRKIGARRVRKI